MMPCLLLLNSTTSAAPGVKGKRHCIKCRAAYRKPTLGIRVEEIVNSQQASELRAVVPNAELPTLKEEIPRTQQNKFQWSINSTTLEIYCRSPPINQASSNPVRTALPKCLPKRQDKSLTQKSDWRQARNSSAETKATNKSPPTWLIRLLIHPVMYQYSIRTTRVRYEIKSRNARRGYEHSRSKHPKENHKTRRPPSDSFERTHQNHQKKEKRQKQRTRGTLRIASNWFYEKKNYRNWKTSAVKKSLSYVPRPGLKINWWPGRLLTRSQEYRKRSYKRAEGRSRSTS